MGALCPVWARLLAKAFSANRVMHLSSQRALHVHLLKVAGCSAAQTGVRALTGLRVGITPPEHDRGGASH